MKLISADSEFESTKSKTPEESDDSVSLTILLYYGTFGWRFTAIDFTLSSIDVDYDVASGAPNGNNITRWDF